MRKLYSLFLITLASLFAFSSCSDSDDPILNSSTEYVNNWIFKEMNIYYLWNNKIPKNPNYNLTPDMFFGSLLNTYNPTINPNGDRFSWIQENYVDLLGSLSGIKSDEIGFEYTFVAANEARTQYYALVTYPKKGTDAYKKGISRGRFIIAVDGNEINSGNYRTIFSGTGSKVLTMAEWSHNTNEDKYELKVSENISVRMEKNFAETPVYMDSVYNIANTKVGYLVYNFFANDKGDNSHAYDRLLMDRLTSIKEQKGATEMVLDLRYNSGGSVSTAIALASALVKNRSTKEILVTAEYNDIVHAALKEDEGADYNKDYFVDKVQGTNIEVPAMNLPRLYVLVTGASASASEFIINGLKPYMDVILIGETTYGKNVGSISIYEKDKPKNKWGMQPIIVKYFNSKGESDFTAGFTPNHEVDEFAKYSDRPSFHLVEFGNLEDPLLSVAIEEITGYSPTVSTRMVGREVTAVPNMIEVKGSNSIFKDKTRFEMYDDIRGESIKELMKNIN